MKRTQVTIEHQTKKAYLITAADGRKGWIQRRWLGTDGTVGEKTLVRAAASFKDREEAKTAARDFSDSYHTITETARETQKAIAVKAVLYFCDIERYKDVLVWLPKSLLKNEAVPGWFVTKKLHELLDYYRDDFSRYGSVLLDSISVADYEDCYAM